MNKKIENNPSFRQLNKNIKGAKAIKQIASFLSPISKTAKDISQSLDGLTDLENKFLKFSKSSDEFNAFFSESGWIAHESMSFNLMQDCIILAKNKDVKAAEDKLADYYISENLKSYIRPLKNTAAFLKRYKLIQLAYEDTIDQRFHSVVPVLLMIIDGSVNDIDKNKGFFTETTELTAWDSIAAHSSGLSKLRDILNMGRNRTNTEEIFLPYRNGILHGRDIEYANKYVVAKCWLTLIAISDWANALKKNKENPPEEVKESSLKESWKELKKTVADYGEHQQRMKEIDDYIDAWKPRVLEIGKDIPLNGNIDAYQEFSPERDAVKFLVNWKNKNYGAIAKQIKHFSKDVNLGKEAGRVRAIFENKFLREYRIISVIDCNPAISEVLVNVIVEFEGRNYEVEIRLRMICQNEKVDGVILGQKNGEWKFISSFFFHKIELLM
ncbi:hypothetical protein [Leadbetterella sp. DM7]|uniref:hypothetical protein n=1 Tax=Leadbetterella sp. DM7 TaxID=3235085 RepID=UPI00349E9A3B